MMQAEDQIKTGEGADLQGDGDGGVRAARAAGRARVQALLVDPLAGLARRRGVSAGDHQAGLAKLIDRLAYLSDANLRALCELVLGVAGRGGVVSRMVPVWPEFGVVQAWAFGLQVPPPRDSDYVPSVMRSVMGAQARDGGWHVELYRAARRLGPPPGKYQILKLREEADENRRTVARIRERVAGGHASPDDHRWLEAWHADYAQAEALVIEGEAQRAARVAAQDAASGGAA